MHPRMAKAKLRICQIWLITSSAISIVSLALWIHSYVRDDRFLIVSEPAVENTPTIRTVWLQSSLGGAQVVVEQISASSLRRAMAFRFFPINSTSGYSSLHDPSYPQVRADHEDSIFYALGIQATFVQRTRDPGDVHESRGNLTLPWWMIFVAFSAYPIIRYVICVIRRQEEDRAALGLCPRCGVPANDLFGRCLGCNRQTVAMPET